MSAPRKKVAASRAKAAPRKKVAGRAAVSARKPSALPTVLMSQVEPISASELWEHFSPPRRSKLDVAAERWRVARTEAERVWSHFTEKDATIFTCVGLVVLLSIGII